MQLNFDWLLVSGKVRVLLPKGEAPRARLRMYGVWTITQDPAAYFDGRVVTFGELIDVDVDGDAEASSPPRRLVVDTETGAVGVRDDHGAADEFAVINSSMDEFLTSLAAFEMWHAQIEESDRPDIALERSLELLWRIDPLHNGAESAWWPALLREVAEAW